MLRKGILSVILLLVLISNCSGSKEQLADNKNILILFSLQSTTPAYIVILEEVRNKLTREFGDNYNLHLEYLEMDRYPEGAFPPEKFQTYNQKYRDVKLDLLICIGINLITTLKANAENYLLDLPAVSFDYDFSNYGIRWDINVNDKTTVIPLKVEAGKSISAILKLLPETTYIYFITGVANGDQLFYSASQQEAKKIDSRVNVNFVTSSSMDEVLKLVRHLPAKSIIIVPRFTLDSKQINYYNTEAVRMISRAANAPVFTYTDMGFGEGAVGGYILSFHKAGLLISDAAIKILHGTDPKSISYQEKDYYENIFDWRELNRWNIAGSDRIPKGSTILFEEVHFFGKYRWIKIGGILFILLQTLLIINLVRMNRKQKMMTLQIRETENKYRELIREDRILRIGQLTASLSHELSQPLTAMLSTAQAGLRFLNEDNRDPELIKEILQHIVEDDKRAASILSSIRGMMKLEKREKERLNLNSLVNDVVAIFRTEVTSHNIELNLHLPEEPVYIFADGIQIQQVILNFVLNAIQSIEIAKAENRMITIMETLNKEYVTVAVRDFGEGIADKVKDKLFKPFVTSKKDGFGIGLSISQSIIHDHLGKIWAENKSDGGAEFSFSLKINRDGN
jgi:signal transduction histidine kinase